MPRKPATPVLWEGKETVFAARSLLKKGLSVELQFPINYHHAFAAHLNPDASPDRVEDIVMEAGPELLARLAEIRGLEDLSTLVKPATEADAIVRLENPASVIISIPER
jgi:hypothetical protein